MLRLSFIFSMLQANIHARVASDRGATAVEYGLLVAVIAAVIVATVVALGDQIDEAFCTVSTKLAETGGVDTAADCGGTA